MLAAFVGDAGSLRRAAAEIISEDTSPVVVGA